jgi:acyl-CoA dehydrogenase
MRAIGMAERTLDLMIARVTDPSRRTFGRILARHGTIAADVAKIRIEINAARLLVLSAADKIDKVNAKGALRDIAMAKVMVPNMLQKAIDLAIQAFGAAGVSQDTPLARFHAAARCLRIADGMWPWMLLVFFWRVDDIILLTWLFLFLYWHDVVI